MKISESFSIQMVFKAIKLDEITQGVGMKKSQEQRHN